MKMKSVLKVVLAVALSLVFMTAGIQGAASAAAAKSSKLQADGGEPGRDYMTYLKALQKKDGATIRKMAEVPAGTSDKELKEQMEMISAMTPSDQKIVSANMNKDTAGLKVIGKLEGKKQYGTISMQKKGGVWKITKEEWSDTEKK